MAEELPLRALLAAGWQPEELEWERLQESALEAAADGRLDEAAARWAEALRLARELFGDGDPRLATSLGNHAAALRRAGDNELADELFDEGLAVWGRSKAWIEALTPEQRAKSSTFHLRLATKNPGSFERLAQQRYFALAIAGPAELRALKDGEPADYGETLALWRKRKPRNFTDGRKLLAAIALLAG